jgi:peptide-methionine (S)-S-oxide reductase
MKPTYKQVGLGGGCHWCTEAVFASLVGVLEVRQGWIASQLPHNNDSEAVLITYDPDIISLHDLIEVHLHTHSSTVNHSMRHKYRSAVYCFSAAAQQEAIAILQSLQSGFDQPIITSVLPFANFKENIAEQLNYYYTDPERPFCQVYIHPKLQLLRKRFSRLAGGKLDVSLALNPGQE